MPIFDRRFRDVMLMDYDLKNQGGLLSGQQGATGGLLGGLSNINPNLLIGSQIAGAGLRGVDPFSAITPAVLQTAQIQQALRPKLGTTKEVFDKQLNKKVFATEQQIQSQPERFIPAPKEFDQLTADQKNFAAYKQVMETGTENEKKLARDIFKKGGRDVVSKQDFLLGVTNNLSKDITLTPEDIQEKLPQYESIYDKVIGTIDSGVTQQNILPIPNNKNELIDGQVYDVQGTPRTWNKKKDIFE